jgi:hypothetical protein
VSMDNVLIEKMLVGKMLQHLTNSLNKQNRWMYDRKEKVM